MRAIEYSYLHQTGGCTAEYVGSAFSDAVGAAEMVLAAY